MLWLKPPGGAKVRLCMALRMPAPRFCPLSAPTEGWAGPGWHSELAWGFRYSAGLCVGIAMKVGA
jgi:hypothetical protein